MNKLLLDNKSQSNMKNLIPLFVALVTLTSGLSAKPIICVNGLNYAYMFATTCPPVSNPNVSDVTETTATITWESGGNETQWLYLGKVITPARRFRMTRGC